MTEEHTEQFEKYTKLKNEITRIWSQKEVNIIPLIISSTGVVRRTLKANLDYWDQ